MGRLAIGFNPVYPTNIMVKYAIHAEQSGYESVWLHESLYQRDAVSYLGAILSATTRLKAASGCINTVTRHPAVAATSFATLSESSGGRVILGLGLGSFPTLPKIGFQVFPTAKSRTLRRITEYLQILRALTEGETVNFQGEFFTAKDLKLEVKPPQKIPIYIASLSQKTLRRAGSLADGVILSPSLSTLKETEKKVGWAREGAKDASLFDIASYMLTSVNEKSSEALKTIREFYFFVYQVAEVIQAALLEPYGVTEADLQPVKEAWKKREVSEAGSKIPDEAIEALTVTGTPDHCLDRIEEYRKAGVNLPIIMPIGDVEAAIESLAPTTQEVMP